MVLKLHINVHRCYPSGKGSFADVNKAIPFILEVSPKASIRMTVTPENVFGMARSVAYFAQVGFNKIMPVPQYEANWTEKKSSETPKFGSCKGLFRTKFLTFAIFDYVE